MSLLKASRKVPVAQSIQPEPPKKKIIRAYGYFSDSGTTNPVNEDSCIVVPERQLFGVADGYGGHNAGDIAAKKTLENVKYFVEHGLGDSEVTLPFVYRTYYTSSANLIFNAFLYANQQLFEENAKKHINGRGGASVVFTFFEGQNMTLASVGSCSAILLREGKVHTLITPRSYQVFKQPTAGWNPKWAFPVMSMGHARDLEPEILELQVLKGDVLLLATDGVYPWLKEEDFAPYQALKGDTAGGLDEKIIQINQDLMREIQARGGADNQTLMVLFCS